MFVMRLGIGDIPEDCNFLIWYSGISCFIQSCFPLSNVFFHWYLVSSLSISCFIILLGTSRNPIIGIRAIMMPTLLHIVNIHFLFIILLSFVVFIPGMASFEHKVHKGKISLPYSEPLRNILKPLKFLKALDTGRIGTEFFPCFSSPSKYAYEPRVRKIIIFLDQIDVGLRWHFLEKVVELC